MTFPQRLWLLFCFCSMIAAPACQAQGVYYTAHTTPGCKIEARAYIDPSVWASSRYDITVVNAKDSPTHWDMTEGWQDADATNLNHYSGGLSHAQSRLPYGKAKETTIKVTLWQYATLEERVTFHNLDLAPLADEYKLTPDVSPRFLALDSAVTATTPSGITITLPAQHETFLSMFHDFNGNPNALFIKIKTTPNQRETALPLSPLYQKYQKPLQIKLDCAPPNLSGFYEADNTYDTIAIILPNLRTATHLDTLTLIVRQRVNLQRLPVSLRLPVFRPAVSVKKRTE